MMSGADETKPAEPIALVGMGGRFPGATNVRELWQLLLDGADAIGTYPGGRFPQADAYFAAAADSADSAAMCAGGFLEKIDEFDAAAFELSPREAMYLDPQQRLLLEAAWAALEDAGQPRHDPKAKNTGVFAGEWASDFENMLYGCGAELELYAMTGSGRNGASGRLSYIFGFDGPSITVDAACSSGLVAVHLACQSLRAGECDMALAGGTNAILAPENTRMFTRAGMLAKDGRCKFGSEDADGFVRSEGAGMVVLKRLSDALAADDPIRAVIRGSAVSNDGRMSGALMTPSREGQRQTLHRAWSAAGVSGAEIRFFEAHGTGTAVGDPVEVGAIADALKDDGATERCWIGSIKTNIGHTESAAGVAGLMKTVLALEHKLVPKSRLTGGLNPKIDWDVGPLRLLTEPLDLSRETKPVVAAVSSFALTGTNAHLVVEEYRKPAAVRVKLNPGPREYLLPVSATSAGALDALLKDYETFSADADLREVCSTASLRRRHDAYRAAFVCEGFAELNESVARARREGLLRGQSAGDGKRRVVFIAPGQGSQWAGMARELLAEEPVFRQALGKCDQAIQAETGWSLIDILLGKETEEALQQIDVVQPALFALSVAFAELWKSWGIVPNAVIGHSMGEVAAAYIAGALSLEDAAAVICRRSRLMKTIRGAGAMLTVELPAKAAEALLREVVGDLSVGASNSPESTVVSGDTEAIARLEATLAGREIFSRRIKVDVASHSSQVDPILGELRAALREVDPRICRLPLLSTVTGGYLTGAEMDAEYWAANLRRPVDYAKGIEALARDGYDVFVELSPHPVLMPGTEATLRKRGGDAVAVAVASTRRGQPERRELLASLVELYRSGCEVNWKSFYPEPARCVALPEYPFQRERCWPSLDELKAGARRGAGSSGRPLLGRRFESAMQPDAATWEIAIDLAALPYLRDHRVHGTVVFPAAAQVELVLDALRAEEPAGEFSLTEMRFESAMQIAEDAEQAFQLGVRRKGDGFHFEIFGRPASGGDWVRFSAGTAERRSSAPEKETLDLSMRDRNGVRHMDKRQHYRLRTRAGIGYGPAFQLLEEAWHGGGESVVRIELRDDPAAKYAIPPALLDNCFQALQLAQPEGEGFLFDDTCLPVSIGQFELYADVAAAGVFYCKARITSADGHAGVLRGDLTIADERGVVVGVVRSFELLRISASLEERAAELLTEIVWEPYEAPGPSGGRERRVLILGDVGGIGEALADRVRGAGGSALLVRHGAESGAASSEAGREYAVERGRREDLDRLFADVVAEGSIPTDVVYLWPLDQKGFKGEETDLPFEDQVGAASLVPTLIQAMSGCGWNEPPRLWLVTGGCMDVGGGVVRPEAAPVWGVGAVAAVEHPELEVSLVDLSAPPACGKAEVLQRLIAGGADEDRFAIRDRKMYVARFARVEAKEHIGNIGSQTHRDVPVKSPEKAKLFRENATYLISGGMGGVGATVAEWMAANGAGCLVLLSRRDENAETRAILGRIEGLGARAVHARTDILDRDALQRLLAKVRREMPPIAGIMHAATVIDDALIAELSAERFDAVMGPKVQGTWNLYDATAEDELDFMVLFSSIAAVYPQPGQGSYAAANAFMDSFAHWARAQGRKVTSINWGGWEQIGLARETGTGRSISGYEQQGIGTMAGPRALSALKRAMELDLTQTVASPIDVDLAAEFHHAGGVPPILRRLLAKAAAGLSNAEPSDVQTRLAQAGSRAESVDVLQRYVAEELGRVLKQAPERIGRDTLFGSIGLDSLMTLEFVRRLKAGLGIAIPTTAVFNHPTAHLLALEIAKRMQVPMEPSGTPIANAETNLRAAASALVADAMSEDEALQALMQTMGS